MIQENFHAIHYLCQLYGARHDEISANSRYDYSCIHEARQLDPNNPAVVNYYLSK